MTAEDFILNNITTDFRLFNQFVTMDNALEAVSMAREEERIKLEGEKEKNTDHQMVLTGWKCPVCGRIHSPYIPICMFCNPSPSKDSIKLPDELTQPIDNSFNGK